MNLRTTSCIIASVILSLTILSGCSSSNHSSITQPLSNQTVREGNLLKSTCSRITTDASSSIVSAVADSNNTFGWSLFTRLYAADSNVVFSPYSLSTALAMTWGGAKGETKTEMSHALHFVNNDSVVFSGLNTIDRQLATRGQGAAGNAGQGFALKTVNALWGEQTHNFLQSFLDPLALYFGSGMRLCDFINNSEQERSTINTWVSDQTNGKIKNLIPLNGVDHYTRLVITNAIYFDAAWADTFQSSSTTKGSFFKSPADTMQSWFMHKTGEYNYNEDQNYQMIELPFDGKKVSMVIVLPKDNNQAATGQIPTYDNIKTLLAGSAQQEVVLTLPKFSFNRISDVVPPLQSMGMKQAFMPPPVANFSGIDGTDSLYVSNIFHQAFVAVDEKGTTAAAATAVVLGVGTCVAPVQHNYFYFTANHPFFFFIRDIPTGQILFIGYMLTPTTASQPIAYRD